DSSNVSAICRRPAPGACWRRSPPVAAPQLQEGSMRSGEIKAIGQLAGDAVARPGVLARDVHRAVAGRTFRALGILGAPVRVTHDAIATAAYASIRSGLGALPRAGAARIARAIPADAAPLSSTVRGSIA